MGVHQAEFVMPVNTIVIVTGLSGAGRNIVMKTLEDLGFDSVDNLPLSLLKAVTIEQSKINHPLALGIDIRARGFSDAIFIRHLKTLKERSDINVHILYCDCDDETLERRYIETRRRHPLSHDRPVMDGIKAERRIISPVREVATYVLDTTHTSIPETKRLIKKYFSVASAKRLFISVVSFSYRYGLPREADFVFDARFLNNPYYQKELTACSGKDQPVQDFILKDECFLPFLKSCQRMLTTIIGRFEQEDRSYLTIAVGCTGGRHRSVFLAESLNKWLNEQSYSASIYHRDLDR